MRLRQKVPSGKEKEGDDNANHSMENRTKDEKTQGPPFPGGSVFHFCHISGRSAYQAACGKGRQKFTVHFAPVAYICCIYSMVYILMLRYLGLTVW
jgi:hypothetical protein